MKCKERELDLELPDYMTKGGPGDKSAPGKIDTSSWFKDQLDRDSWAYNPFVCLLYTSPSPRDPE